MVNLKLQGQQAIHAQRVKAHEQQRPEQVLAFALPEVQPFIKYPVMKHQPAV